LTWSLSDAGVLSGATADGTVLVTSAGATAYDATKDEHTGLPLHSAPLNLALTGVPGVQQLVVTVPSALLNDPATVFPVTIDPSTSWSKTAHTYVDSGFATTSYYNANVLLGVGTYNGGTNKNRTMFAFNTGGILGKHVITATINLNEAGSWNCTAQPFDLWSVGAFGSTTTWNTQAAAVTKYATITAAKGYSSACPAGNIAGDVTSWAAAVAAGSNSTSYLELRAQSETDNNQWKKFNPAAIVTLTYDSYPGTPTGRTVTPCTAQCSSPTLTNTTTPSLGAFTTDPDGQTLRSTTKSIAALLSRLAGWFRPVRSPSHPAASPTGNRPGWPTAAATSTRCRPTTASIMGNRRVTCRSRSIPVPRRHRRSAPAPTRPAVGPVPPRAVLPGPTVRRIATSTPTGWTRPTGRPGRAVPRRR